MTIWEILEIPETNDKDVIKNAYRKKLQKVNPEDDPEGFMALRKAFEEANKKADDVQADVYDSLDVCWNEALTEDDLEDMTQKQRIDHWIQRAGNLYSHFYERIQTENWEFLLDDDVCQQLDMVNETREEFLKFLMDHTKFPNRIWKLFDRTFSLVDDSQELKDKFPVDFIDYVKNAVMYEGVVDFDLFEGADDASYDDFMEAYFMMKYHLDYENFDEAAKQLDVMERLDISHPYMNVEKSRLLVHDGRAAEACELMAPIAAAHGNLDYVLYFYGTALMAANRDEEARTVFDKILSYVPEHYMARLSMADIMLKEGKYKEAKDAYLALIEINEHDELVIDQLKEANEYLIPEYEKKIEENPQDLDSILDLGWCLCQNEHYEKCLSMLETLQVDEEHLYDYTNLRGRILLCLNRFDEALPYLLQWRQMIEDTVDDGEEKTRKRIKRMGYANYAIAMCYASDNVKDFENAVVYIDKAIETEKSADQLLSCYYGKADIYKRLKKYEAAVDICSDIIEKEKRFYPAYVLRMECFYDMGYGGDVVNDYYNAVSLYPAGERPYEITCELFIESNVFDRAKEVLDQAKACDVHSLTLEILKLRVDRKNAKSADELQNVADAFKKLLEEKNEEFKDDAQRAQCYYLTAIVYCDLFIMYDQDMLDKGLENIKKAIEADPENEDYENIKAYIYSKQGRTKEALTIYKKLLESNPDNCYYLFRIAGVYGDCRKLKSALKYYKKVAGIDEKYPDVFREIGVIYRELAEEEHQRGYYRQAILAFNRQIEAGENQYDLIERGRLYMELGMYAEAEKDIRHTLEINENNIYAYNALGDIYRYQRKYPQAIEWYQKGIDRVGDENTPVLYENMAQCYECMGLFDKVAVWYDKALELFPGRGRIYEKYARFYERLKQYDKAVALFEKGRGLNLAYKKYFNMQIAEMMEKYAPKEALKIYKQYYKENNEDIKACYGIARYYMFFRGRYKKALDYYDEGLNLALKNKDPMLYRDGCFGAGLAYFFMNKRGHAAAFFKKALTGYKERYPDIFESEIPVGMDANDFYMIGRLFALSGDLNRAHMYFEAMKDERRGCEYCVTCTCFEYLMGNALLAYLTGNVNEAVRQYKRALAIAGNDSECLIALRMLGERI